MPCALARATILKSVARQKARRAKAAPKNLLRSEHGVQSAFFAALGRIEHPAARAAFAIPNGAVGASWGRRNRFGAEGVRRGVPDIFIGFPSNGKHGLFLEFKYGNNNPTKEQIEWLQRLERNGYAVGVPYSVSEALILLSKYLNITLPPELLS